MTMVHPSREELINYHYGWLPPQDTTRVAAHLKSCPFCALDTVLAEDYFELVADTLPVVNSSRPTLHESVLGQIQRVVAYQVTRATMALAGQEAADAPTIYESGGVQIALRVVEMDEEKGIMGLVTGLEDLPLEAQLRVAEGRGGGMLVPVDEAGQFYFACVPTTAYDVVIIAPTMEIEIHVSGAPR
jgi:hypothetical protein